MVGEVIDSLRFAAAEGTLTGRLAVAGLSRLASSPMLFAPDGWLQYELRGYRNVDAASAAGGDKAKGMGQSKPRPALHLRVCGRLQLCCQRCLEPMDFVCDIDNMLWLFAADEAWPEDELEADAYDALAADAAMSTASLVEDEVLLALPLSPRHDNCRHKSVLAPASDGLNRPDSLGRPAGPDHGGLAGGAADGPVAPKDSPEGSPTAAPDSPFAVLAALKNKR